LLVTEVIMPKMGDGMEEGTLLEWLKKEGDSVKSGEVLGTIQTDKATLELESPGTGTLSGFLIGAGATVPVGKPIAAILKAGEALPAGWGSGAAAPAAATVEAEPAAKPEPVLVGAASAPATAAEPSGRVKASPLAKRVAQDLGIDLRNLRGSGPGGRILEKDIQAMASAAPAVAVAQAAPVTAGAGDTVVPLTRLRQITAQRTTQSKQQVPHYYVTVEVDVEKILALRELFEEEQSGKASINDFVVKACASALAEMPEVNATFEGDKVLQYDAIHIGIAAAIEEGLTVPVLRNAGALSLRQIAEATRDLVTRARENKLSLDELSGSTFSISNMGMLNVDNFAAIINQPNAAILAVSSVRKKVVPTDDDEIEIRSRMNVTCSFDHRVVDGARGAVFINKVREYLENPSRLIG
jgi:pyruvate dehydrogenase E2 component (dihydrolipoamide acetyltransferase)